MSNYQVSSEIKICVSAFLKKSFTEETKRTKGDFLILMTPVVIVRVSIGPQEEHAGM